MSPSEKKQTYATVIEQVKALLADETDVIANMANVASLLHESFGFWWTGFYRVEGEQLVLGPFQGPLACTRIPYGRGVCGTSWQRRQTVVVPDVEQFPGHIACSSESRSEIVVPVFARNAVHADATSAADRQVVAVLDIDSRYLATFDDTDRCALELIAEILAISY